MDSAFAACRRRAIDARRQRGFHLPYRTLRLDTAVAPAAILARHAGIARTAAAADPGRGPGRQQHRARRRQRAAAAHDRFMEPAASLVDAHRDQGDEQLQRFDRSDPRWRQEARAAARHAARAVPVDAVQGGSLDTRRLGGRTRPQAPSRQPHRGGHAAGSRQRGRALRPRMGRRAPPLPCLVARPPRRTRDADRFRGPAGSARCRAGGHRHASATTARRAGGGVGIACLVAILEGGDLCVRRFRPAARSCLGRVAISRPKSISAGDGANVSCNGIRNSQRRWRRDRLAANSLRYRPTSGTGCCATRPAARPGVDRRCRPWRALLPAGSAVRVVARRRSSSAAR